MGEIKSTLDLVMERAEKIEVSPEEKEKLKREEYVSKARGMANRYLNGNLNIAGLIKKLDSYDGNQNQRDMVVETLLSELVGAIAISLDNKRSLEAIRILKQGRVDLISDRIDKLCQDFSGEKESRKQKTEKETRRNLHRMGISGTAVQPHVGSDERWYRTLVDLTSKYEAELVKLKGELLELDGK